MLATGEVKCIDEEIPFEIPKGWKWCRLRDLCTVFGRIGFRGYTRNDIVEKGFGAITLSPSNMQDNGNMNYSVVSYISWKKYEESPEIKVKANDVLIVKTGSSYGKTCIISDLPEKATINPQIAVLKYSFVNNQWLTYFLNAPLAQEQFRKYVIGTSIPTFSQEKLSSTLLPLPPKNEQEHLIKKLSLLGKCIGSYNVIQQLIDRLNVDIYDKLKKSILQEAIQGKLVPQTAEEGTAKELLEQIKAEKQKLVKEGKLKKSALNDSIILRGDDNKYYEKIGKKCMDITEELPFDLPNNWTWCRLGNLISITSGENLTSKQMLNGKIPVYGGNGITGYHSKANIFEETIVIGRVGYYCGSIHLTPCQAWVTDNAFITQYSKLLNRDFLIYLLTALNLGKCCNATAQPVVSGKKIYPLLIALPPFKEQQRIVAQIEKLFEQLH